MIKVNLEIHDDVVSALNKLRDLNDTGIELEIPAGSVLFENILNLKLLKKESEKLGKVLHLETFDEVGQQLIGMLNEEAGIEEAAVPSIIAPVETTVRSKPQMPKIKLPALNFNFLNMGGGKKKYILIGGGVLALILVISLIARAPKAYAKVIVTNMPLTKSLTIKAIKGTVSNVENKSIRATTLSTEVSDKITVPATGTKIIGKKAKGTVKIYNKTDSSKDFKKGNVLIYKKDNEELKYVLTENATAPARTQEPEDPGNPGVITYKAGEVEIDIESQDVGSKYNIDKDKDLSVDGKKTSEFSAKTTTSLSGGESSTVKAIAEADKTKATTDLLATLKQKAETSLKAKLGKEQKLIEGSMTVTAGTPSFNHAVGEEAEELELNQTVTVQALTYFQNDVEKLVVQMAEGFVPDGFVLSDKEKEITVQALGKTDTSVLTETEADLQVTLKTYVVPDINEEELKEEIAGKSISEAQRILGGIKNIKTYELQINPSIPFLQKVPSDINKIELTVERE